MKKLLLPFYYIYLVAIALPIIVAVTIIAAVITIVATYFVGDKQWTYLPGRWWARIICIFTLVKIKIHGLESVDAERSTIYLLNHQSVYDVFVIYGYLNCRFKWIMKQELRKIPFVGKACEAAGHIFINREHAFRAQKSIEEAEKKLTNGASVVMFPEGHRTRNGKIQPFKKGAFVIASHLHLPVVPITVKGAFDVMPPSRILPIPGKIEVFIHSAIDTTTLTHDNLEPLITQCQQQIVSAL